MTSNFKFTTNYFINSITCQLFIQKKTTILVKILTSITNKNRDCPFSFCSINDTFSSLVINIEKVLIRYRTMNMNDHNNIIEILLDENYCLPYHIILLLPEKIEKSILIEMVEIQKKITNYINNHLFTKILKIENNQKLLIYNQIMLMESMNQINGMNYTIQVNNYLTNINCVDKISKMNHFYQEIVKKMTSYNLASSVLTSGEISVNDSMVTTQSSLIMGGLHLIETAGESIPMGKVVACIANAGGIYYVNKTKLEDNEAYNNMLDSVIHTDGIAKLSGLRIIKQIDLENITIERINTKYAHYLTDIWRNSQLHLIKNKLLPLYDGNQTTIDDLVINITKYHHQLCSIILEEFIIRIKDNDYYTSCVNILGCINKDNIIYDTIVDDNNTLDRLLHFIQLKNVFTSWKQLVTHQ